MDLEFKFIIPQGHYLRKNADKHGEVAGTFLSLPEDVVNWPGSDVIAYICNYEFYGESYPYNWDAPTPERVDQWWAEGVRKFVLWDKVGGEMYRIRFSARFLAG